jgi:hypothetical protein
MNTKQKALFEKCKNQIDIIVGILELSVDPDEFIPTFDVVSKSGVFLFQMHEGINAKGVYNKLNRQVKRNFEYGLVKAVITTNGKNSLYFFAKDNEGIKVEFFIPMIEGQRKFDVKHVQVIGEDVSVLEKYRF